MGSFFVTSMITTLLTTLVIGGVLVFVLVWLAKARSGGSGGTNVQNMADPVPGILMVTAAAMPSRNSLYHMTRITGVVSGDGIEPTAVQYAGLIRTSLWPSPGKQLPVIVDRADPRKFAIQWDQAANAESSALGQAEALAAAMRTKRKDSDA